MNPSIENPAFSPLQTELFTITGLVFDIQVDLEEVRLILARVHALSLPLEVLDNPAEFLQRDLNVSKVRPGPTLVQRRALLALLQNEQSSVRQKLFGILQKGSLDDRATLARLQQQERQTRQTLCLLIWELDDVAVERLAQELGA